MLLAGESIHSLHCQGGFGRLAAAAAWWCHCCSPAKHSKKNLDYRILQILASVLNWKPTQLVNRSVPRRRKKLVLRSSGNPPTNVGGRTWVKERKKKAPTPDLHLLRGYGSRRMRIAEDGGDLAHSHSSTHLHLFRSLSLSLSHFSPRSSGLTGRPEERTETHSIQEEEGVVVLHAPPCVMGPEKEEEEAGCRLPQLLTHSLTAWSALVLLRRRRRRRRRQSPKGKSSPPPHPQRQPRSPPPSPQPQSQSSRGKSVDQISAARSFNKFRTQTCRYYNNE